MIVDKLILEIEKNSVKINDLYIVTKHYPLVETLAYSGIVAVLNESGKIFVIKKRHALEHLIYHNAKELMFACGDCPAQSCGHWWQKRDVKLIAVNFDS